MERNFFASSILLIALLLILFSLGGCVGHSSVSAGARVDDYYSPYYRSRASVSHYYHHKPVRHRGRTGAIGRPHHGPKKVQGVHRRPAPARHSRGHRKH